MAIIDEQPPEGTEYPLKEYLSRMFRFARFEDADHASRLALLELNIVNLVEAGYGGAYLDTDTLFDVPASPNYNTMLIDTLRPTTSLGFSADLVSETFSFSAEGVWKVNITFNIAGISELNQSRSFRVRIYNVTTASETAFVIAPVSRNQGDVLVSVPIMFDVTSGNVNNTLRVELGGGDAISGGTLIGASVTANRVDELGDV